MSNPFKINNKNLSMYKIIPLKIEREETMSENQMSGEQRTWIICISIFLLTIIILSLGFHYLDIRNNQKMAALGYEQTTQPSTNTNMKVWQKAE